MYTSNTNYLTPDLTPWPVPIVADASAIDLRADYTVKRVVEFCDGWFPYPHDGWDPKAAVTRLRQAAIDAGRDPATLSSTVFKCSCRSGRARRLPRCGHPGSVARCAGSTPRRGPAHARQKCSAHEDLRAVLQRVNSRKTTFASCSLSFQNQKVKTSMARLSYVFLW